MKLREMVIKEQVDLTLLYRVMRATVNQIYPPSTFSTSNLIWLLF